MGSRPPPPQLPEDLAFELATRWHDSFWVDVRAPELAGLAPGAVDASRTYHWESITLAMRVMVFHPPLAPPSSGVERAGQSARACAIAWLALASCSGYSGRENPRFWRRVLAYLMTGSRRRHLADDVRFFEHPDRPCPCMRIKPIEYAPFYNLQKQFLRALFRPSAIDSALRRELARLKPYYLSGRKWWRREVPVEIHECCLDNRSPPRSFLPTWRHNARQLPTLRVVSVEMRRIANEASLRSVMSRISDVAIHVPEYTVKERVFRVGQRAPGVDKRVHIGTLRPWWQGERASFGAMRSALPYVDAVKKLGMASLLHNARPFSNTHVAWLGYALLHPDAAANSELRRLVLNLEQLPDRTTEMLQLMATGNNLRVAMGTTTTVSTAYHVTQLARRTRVRRDAGGRATADVIHTLAKGQRVTVCVASLDELKAVPWVSIVAPGVGLGWVKTKRIQNIVSRGPGRSTLRGLELNGTAEHAEASAPRVLSVLGASLTSLKIAKRLSTRALQAVLRNCPELTHLVVRHDGDCWSRLSAAASLASKPRLQSLKLYVSGPLRRLDASQLDDLTSLHVVAEDLRGTPFTTHREAFVALLRRYPALSRVHWSHQFCAHSPVCGFESASTCGPSLWADDHKDYQSSSSQLLGEGAWRELGLANRRVGLDERLAFLSVFGRKKADGKPLARLPPDVVRVVLAFAATVPRFLRIDDCRLYSPRRR